jgi:hypothetical protein
MPGIGSSGATKKERAFSVVAENAGKNALRLFVALAQHVGVPNRVERWRRPRVLCARPVTGTDWRQCRARPGRPELRQFTLVGVKSCLERGRFGAVPISPSSTENDAGVSHCRLFLVNDPQHSSIKSEVIVVPRPTALARGHDDNLAAGNMCKGQANGQCFPIYLIVDPSVIMVREQLYILPQRS